MMAQTPTLICNKSFLAIPLNQFPKRFVTLAGGDKLKVIYIIRHTMLQVDIQRTSVVWIHLYHRKHISYLSVSFSKVVFS
jgi:hypothetical protein